MNNIFYFLGNSLQLLHFQIVSKDYKILLNKRKQFSRFKKCLTMFLSFFSKNAEFYDLDILSNTNRSISKYAIQERSMSEARRKRDDLRLL